MSQNPFTLPSTQPSRFPAYQNPGTAFNFALNSAGVSLPTSFVQPIPNPGYSSFPWTTTQVPQRSYWAVLPNQKMGPQTNDPNPTDHL